MQTCNKAMQVKCSFHNETTPQVSLLQVILESEKA